MKSIISRVFPDTAKGNEECRVWYLNNEAKGYRHHGMERLPMPVNPETGDVMLLATARWKYTMRLEQVT